MFSIWLAGFRDAVLWYLVGLAFSGAVFGYFYRWGPRSLAWPLARCLGPWLVAWVAVAPSAVLGTIPFSPYTVAAAWVALAAGSAAFFPRKLSKEDRVDIAAFEALWVASFAAMVAIQPWVATISQNDSILDLAHLSAILRQRQYPFEDPALAGHTLHYYVFGFYTRAAQAFFTGLDPLQSYRAAWAAVFGGTVAALGVFLRALGLRPRLAYLAAPALCLVANPEAAYRFFRKVFLRESYNTATATGWLSEDFIGGGFWSSGLFSGAVHGSAISLSILPVFYACLAAAALAPKKQSPAVELFLALTAGTLGAFVFGTNTWEVPLYLGATLAFFGATFHRRPPRRTLWLMATTIGTFAFVHLPFTVLAAGEKLRLVGIEIHTTLPIFLRQWGAFCLPWIVAALARLRRPGRADWVALALLGASIVLNDALWFLCFCAAAAFAQMGGAAPRQKVCLQLAILAFGILAVTELVYLKNITPGRFNTLAHLNPLAWNLLLVAVAVWLWDVWPRLGRIPRGAVAATAVLLGLPYTFVFELKGRVVDFRTFDSDRGQGLIAARSRDDAELIRWLSRGADEGKWKGVLLEASDEEYTPLYSSRLSAFTGVRSYLGYSRHAFQTMMHHDHPDISARKAFVASLGSGSARAVASPERSGCRGLAEALRRERIDYVAVGSLEREKFGAGFLAALERCFTAEARFGQAAFYPVAALKPE